MTLLVRGSYSKEGWIGDRSVPMTSALGYSSAKSLGASKYQ